MSHIFFQSSFFVTFPGDTTENFGKININVTKTSQNQQHIPIGGILHGSNFWYKFGKSIGLFSFSQWHIPAKKNLEYNPMGSDCEKYVHNFMGIVQRIT